MGIDTQAQAHFNAARLEADSHVWLTRDNEKTTLAKRILYQTLRNLKYDLLHATVHPIEGDHILSRQEATKQKRPLRPQLGIEIAEGDREFVFAFLRPRGFPYPNEFASDLTIYVFDLEVVLKAGYDVTIEGQDRGFLRGMGAQNGYILGNVHYCDVVGPFQDNSIRSKIRRFITTEGKVHEIVMREDTEVLRGRKLVFGLARLALQFIEQLQQVDPSSAATLLTVFYPEWGAGKTTAEIEKARCAAAAELVAMVNIHEATIAGKIPLTEAIHTRPLLREIRVQAKEKDNTKKLVKHANTQVVIAPELAKHRQLETLIKTEKSDAKVVEFIKTCTKQEINQKLELKSSVLYAGRDVLMEACDHGRLAVVSALVSQGANVAALRRYDGYFYRDKLWENGLMVARWRHQLDIVFYLASVGARNENGMPINIISARGRVGGDVVLADGDKQLIDTRNKTSWDVCQRAAVKGYSYANPQLTPLFAEYFIGMMRNHILPQPTHYRLVEIDEVLYLVKQSGGGPKRADEKLATEPHGMGVAIVELWLSVLNLQLCGQSVPVDMQAKLSTSFDEVSRNKEQQQALRLLLSFSDSLMKDLIVYHGYLPHSHMFQIHDQWITSLKKQCATYIAAEEKQQGMLLNPLLNLVKILTEASHIVAAVKTGFSNYVEVQQIEVTYQFPNLRIQYLPMDHYDYKLKAPQIPIVPYALGCRSVANYDAFEIRPLVHNHHEFEIALHGMPRVLNDQQFHGPFTSVEQVLLTLLAREFKTILISMQNHEYLQKHLQPHPVTGRGATESAHLLNDKFLGQFVLACELATDKVILHLKELPPDYDRTALALKFANCLGLDSKLINMEGNTVIFNVSLMKLLEGMVQNRVNYQGAIILNEDGAIALADYHQQGYCGPGGHCSDNYHPVTGTLVEVNNEFGFVPAANFDAKSVEVIRFNPDHVLCVFPHGSLRLSQAAQKYTKLYQRPFKAEAAEFAQGSETFLTPQQLREGAVKLRNIQSLDIYLQHEEKALASLLATNPEFKKLRVTVGCGIADTLPSIDFGIIKLTGEVSVLERFKQQLAQHLPARLKPISIYQTKDGLQILNIAPAIFRQVMTVMCGLANNAKTNNDEKAKTSTSTRTASDYVVEPFTQTQLRALSCSGVALRQRMIAHFGVEFLAQFNDKQLQMLSRNPQAFEILIVNLKMSHDLIKECLELFCYFFVPTEYSAAFPMIKLREKFADRPDVITQLFNHLINDRSLLENKFFVAWHGLDILSNVPAELKPLLMNRIASPVFMTQMMRSTENGQLCLPTQFFDKDILVIFLNNVHSNGRQNGYLYSLGSQPVIREYLAAMIKEHEAFLRERINKEFFKSIYDKVMQAPTATKAAAVGAATTAVAASIFTDRELYPTRPREAVLLWHDSPIHSDNEGANLEVVSGTTAATLRLSSDDEDELAQLAISPYAKLSLRD